jgi:hypothetical protein
VFLMLLLTEGIGLMLASCTCSATTLHILLVFVYCCLIVLGLFLLLFKVLPCAGLALLIHPSTSHNIVNRISWGFCVYLEAVSVLPQLHLMQNTKVISPYCHLVPLIAG